ncbi:prolyl-tRNA synthetase associated domain-containing protein [Candidatus Woesearchaeota archaeon]|nr:prolyl-tRNA synthetase associated domain-containing protein [Candidatus Woesearchaeota archaeon]
MRSEVKRFLEENHIVYRLHTHPAVFTVEEAEKHCSHIPGLACKNLFLKDKISGRFFLVIMAADKKIDLRWFSGIIGSKHIRFGDDRELMDLLGLTKGSVSPFGLLNDKEGKVIVYIDHDVWDADIVSFHPNINTESLELSREMFHRFMDLLEQKKEVISFGS